MADPRVVLLTVTFLLILPLTAGAGPDFSGAQPNGTLTNNQQEAISVNITSEQYNINESSIFVEINDTSGTAFEGGTDNASVEFTESQLTINPLDTGFSMAEGLVNVSVKANDTEGNTSNTTWNFTIDTTSPQITGFNNSQISRDEAEIEFQSNEELGDIRVRLEYSDSKGGSSVFWKSLTQQNFTENSGTYTAVFNPEDSGYYTAILQEARDIAGNNGASDHNETAFVYTENADLSNPSPNSTLVEDSQEELSVGLNVDTSPPEDSILWQVNDSTGTVFEDDLGKDGVNFSSGKLTLDPFEAGFEMEDGQVDVFVQANFSGPDNIDNITWSFDMDDKTPTIKDFNAEQTQDNKVEISFNSSEELTDIIVEVSGAENVLLDESSFVTEDGTSPFRYSGEFTPENEAEYEFTLDTAATTDGFDGARGQSSVLNFTTPPSLSNAAPNSSLTNNTQEIITVDITDGIGVDENSITVEVNDSSGTAFSGGTGSSGVSFSSNTLTVDPSAASFTMNEGNVDVGVNVSDTVGNTAYTEWNFTLDTTPPTITNYGAVNVSDNEIEVTFTSDEQLDDILVDITGPETTSIDESDFSYTEDSGSFDYTGEFRPGSSGEYNFTLNTAKDEAGNDGASGESARVEVDAPPRIDVFELTEESQEINLTIESTKSLDVIDVDLGGDISGTLTRSDFDQLSASPYTYETTVFDGVEGYFNATLNTAEDSAGQDGASGEIAELDTNPPQNPSTTSISGPIDPDNQDNVEVNVNFDQAPVSGTLTVKIIDSNGDATTEEFSTNTGTSQQSVFLDLSSLPDGDVYAQAKMENEYGYVNPDGFTAESSTVLKDTDIPEAVGAITGDSLNGNSNSTNMVAIEYDDVGSINPNTVSLNTFEIRNGTDPMNLAGYSIEDGYFLIELEDDISTDMEPVAVVEDGWEDSVGNTQDSTVLFTVDDGLGPELESATIDHERSDSDNTVVKLEFSEEIIDGSNLGIDGNAKSVSTSDNEAYVTYTEVLNTGTGPDVTGIQSVADTDGNQAFGDQTVKTMVKQFDQGWNSFSLPVETGETYQISSLLDTSKIESVWRYSNGEWEVYDPDAPNQDFTSFEPGKGYLIDVSESHEQGINVDTGSGIESLEISEGWNLVAHMQEYNMTADDQGSFSSLSSVEDVEALNSNSLSYGNATYAVPGEAYWVKSGSTDTLTGSFTSQTSMGFFSWISSTLNSIFNSLVGVIFG